MKQLAAIAILLIFSFLSNANAGGYYSNPYSSDNVIAPVTIGSDGIYNLVVSIQFLNEPFDKKPYTSDEYKKLIQRLSVQWSEVALDAVLESKVSDVAHLVELKNEINKRVSSLVNETKLKYEFNKDVEVIFTLTNFYLLDSNN